MFDTLDPGVPIRVVRDDTDPGVTHLYPETVEAHVLDRDGTCWCGPSVVRPCTQCDGRPGCWACEGGLVRGPLAPGDRGTVIHRNVGRDGRPNPPGAAP